MSGLVIAVVAAGIVVVGGMTLALVRHRHRRRDSVQTFSAATSAMRHMAEHPSAPTGEAAPHPEVATPNVHVLGDVGARRLDRTRSTRASARARRRRPDADAIARRPTIASLPSISSPKRSSAPDEREG